MLTREDTTRLSINWNEYMQALAFQSQAAQANTLASKDLAKKTKALTIYS